MKRLSAAFLLAALWPCLPCRTASAQVVADFFFEEGCSVCAATERETIAPAEAHFGEALRVERRDIGSMTNFLLLASYGERLGMDLSAPVSAVVGGDTALCGRDAIASGFRAAVAAHLAESPRQPAPESDSVQPDVTPDGLLARLTPVAVFVAGLVDGFNPCAFATLVFLASVISLGRRPRREAAVAGLAFCAASFLAYFALGLGLLSGLSLLRGSRTLRLALDAATFLGASMLSLLSFRDAFRFARTGRASSVALKLPDAVKGRIHALVLARLRGPAITAAAFLCGLAVTLLESVCTGQLYLPALSLMSRAGSHRARLLLLLYDAAFVVPLAAILLLSLGASPSRAARATMRDTVVAKVLMGAVLLAVAAAVLLRHA